MILLYNFGLWGTDDPRWDLYIARCVPWKWHDGDTIDIVDADGKTQHTLGYWQTWIFYEADGGRTVKKLLAWISGHYQKPQTKPPDLDRIVIKELTDMVENKRIVELGKEGPILADDLLNPLSEQG